MFYEIRHYVTASEKDVYLEWLRTQRDLTAKQAAGELLSVTGEFACELWLE